MSQGIYKANVPTTMNTLINNHDCILFSPSFSDLIAPYSGVIVYENDYTSAESLLELHQSRSVTSELGQNHVKNNNTGINLALNKFILCSYPTVIRDLA